MKMIPLMFRAGSFCMVRKVPKRYAAVEARKQVWLSLNTDNHVETVISGHT
ncbi:hypothetical protein M3484_16845 [Pseudomonas sp. GX19020]|uniref:hypothetical protein n=1 Tax=Pseudomonas sp. GX19020 TaxID=2942277 RepID=UPI0020190C52|nr:hypothetical protein [Pseudomonas sp. GX19020]MCL4068238.1 hypothetical protein [Pseudomonas sp. GX19020]